MFKLKLRQDGRDAHAFMKFGQIAKSDLDKPVNFDDPTIIEKIQPNGNVQCVLFTAEYIAQNKTKKEYDIDELWTRVPHYATGTDLREVFGEIVKNGLKVKGSNVYEKPFSSYWRADTGDGRLDAFDNARSASLLAQSPIAIASYWFDNWLNLPNGAVMPIGKNPLNGHMYAQKGWNFANVKGEIDVNGVPMLIIEWWGGKTNLMPRETFNHAMSYLGVGAWVLSDSIIDTKRQKTILEAIRDLCINTIIALKALLVLKKIEPVIEPVKETPKDVYEEVKEALKYDWSTPEKARHSVRVICDEHGLSLKLKNIVTACIMQESQFNPKAISPKNKNGTRDWGIVQINDGGNHLGVPYWIGPTRLFENTQEVLDNPEKGVRFMAKETKKYGYPKWWSSYSTGAYKKWM